jgi:hypothetical protein
VQGGYVSHSQGQQLNVTKKSNALDKPKPNILNSAAKKLHSSSNDQSNNNNNNNNSNSSNNNADSNDSGPVKHSYDRAPSPIAPPPAVPEVTVK